jgi:hypothetical protein
MYWPTDIPFLVPIRKEIFKAFTVPNITPAVLNAAPINPAPTHTPVLKSPLEGAGLDARLLLSIGVFGGSVIGEFLVKGLVNGGLPLKSQMTIEPNKVRFRV